ncbi:transcription elongation factor B polypeptide 1 [Platysternon megacephalum]|uniref:Carboxypeptidase B n=1 Tax=Platysternon megacephalum TaxID=55544 RepID=A0A4D9E4P9_9SAUR|nr:transcription elongation factor B polypeptide 1 [Platysternon megacephalum]
MRIITHPLLLKKMWAVLVLVGAAAASAPLHSHHFDGEKVFRVTPHNEEQVEFLNTLASNMQIDFWNPETVTQVKPEMRVDFRVEADKSSDVESLLEQSGVEYEILIDNLKTVLDAQFDSNIRATGHNYEKYNNWETIAAWTSDIAAQNANLVSRTQIGTTFQGRPMYLLKVGKSGSNKKAIFMDCGFHAREWISPAFCQWFVKEAVSTYGSDTLMTRLLNNLDFYILPVLNIDGYVYTWTNYRMWRKTRSTNSDSSCIGTDPNRNFNAGWCSVGASKRPCDDTYCGSAPESEKETKALADFIRKNLSTIKAYLTIHSYSQMLLFPYSYTYSIPENYAELNTISKAAVQELASLYGTKYTSGAGASTIYPAAGGSDDWAYDQGIKYSFTFELRDTGRYGFALPESQIKPTSEETLKAVKYIANYVLDHLY